MVVYLYFGDWKVKREPLRALDEVLCCLDKAGLQVKQKCAFMRSSVTNLGHRIDAQGLHLLQDRVRAIQEAPIPTSVPKFKSYQGMLSYYSKFLPIFSMVLHPLHVLLRKDVPRKWGEDQVKAFTALKELLTSESCLTHFDSSLQLNLACYASAEQSCLTTCQMAPRPIGYASRTLTTAECNYSQLDKRDSTTTCLVDPSN